MARVLERSAKEGAAVPAQEPSRAHLEVHVDSYWAGEMVSRRSTSEVIARTWTFRHSSTVQNVIGLSSAEVRLSIGLQSLFADWNLKLQLSLHTDSSRAKAIASRRGTGKSTRHIQTMVLWLQERVAAKHLRVVKVATESNPADMLTKTLGRSAVEELCADIGQTEPRAETVDKESKGAKKPKEVKFAVETMETNEEQVEGCKNPKGQEQVEGCKNCKDQVRVES